MNTAESLMRHNIQNYVECYVSDVVPIMDIVKSVHSSYPKVERILKDMGYNIEKRTVTVKRKVLSIKKGDYIENRYKNI